MPVVKGRVTKANVRTYVRYVHLYGSAFCATISTSMERYHGPEIELCIRMTSRGSVEGLAAAVVCFLAASAARALPHASPWEAMRAAPQLSAFCQLAHASQRLWAVLQDSTVQARIPWA